MRIVFVGSPNPVAFPTGSTDYTAAAVVAVSRILGLAAATVTAVIVAESGS